MNEGMNRQSCISIDPLSCHCFETQQHASLDNVLLPNLFCLHGEHVIILLIYKIKRHLTVFPCQR